MNSYERFERQLLGPSGSKKALKFGREVKRVLFPSLQSHYLAHGSYGACMEPAIQYKQTLMRQIESNPAYFFYNTLYPLLGEAIQALAVFLGVPAKSIVLVRNLEIGLQSVLHSLRNYMNAWEVIGCFDMGYGAVNLAIQQLAERYNWSLCTFNSTNFVPGSSVDLLNAFRCYCECYRPRVMVLEHIASPTGLVMPLAQLASICKSYECLVFVDGAHGIGQVEIDLSEIDFYCSNLHKWMSSPRGCAFLYISMEHLGMIDPLLVTWGYNQGILLGIPEHSNVQSKFVWQGTDDYTPFLTIPILLRTYREIPWIERNHQLALWAGNSLMKIWQTKILGTEIEQIGAMVSVLLPPVAHSCGLSQAEAFQKVKDDYQIEAPVFIFKGETFIRISCFIYNDEQDILYCAAAVLQGFGYPSNGQSLSRLQEIQREVQEHNAKL